MALAEKRTVSLPYEQASCIYALVSQGSHASASEVVRAGLWAQQESEAAVERWLRERVAPVYDTMQADPSRAISADQVQRSVRAHHEQWLKARRDAQGRLPTGSPG